ncbi:MAG: BamA/TamA family outer membrane protein [Deltaproteobacteria bacterium]|nr:BamA/TamA family outer membrane protein [Deltaproteobacteria bacterium]
MFRFGIASSVVLAGAVASAQPGFVQQPPAEPPKVAPAQEPPPDVDHAPLPGQESGRTDVVDDGDTTKTQVERIAAKPVLWLVEATLAPVHGAITLWGRHRMSHQVGGLGDGKGVAFDINPLLRVDSGHGIAGFAGGAHAAAKNLFGEHEQLGVLAAGGAGGYIRQLYAVELDSGHRFGDSFALAVDGRYEDRPRDGFYGDGSEPVLRFSQKRAATDLVGDVRIADELHLRPSATLASNRYTSPIDGTALHAASADGQLELRWSNEHATGDWDQAWLPTDGTAASLAVARSQRLDDAPDFWRARLDVEQLVRLGIGPRVLAFRLHGEGVSTAAVPLPELPSLGGPLYLRGYALDQFRDRYAAVATIDYRWDLATWMGAHLFVDAGRVAPALDAFALTGVHVGYGGGILVGRHGAAIDLASTLDGGIMFAASIGLLPSTAAAAR